MEETIGISDLNVNIYFNKKGNSVGKLFGLNEWLEKMAVRGGFSGIF